MNNTKKEMLLTFIYFPVNEREVVTPVQIMKGLFLLGKRLKVKRFYEFEPYLYGPCSFEIYSGLEDLSRGNLIDSVDTPFSWKCYRATKKGREKAKTIIEKMGKEDLKELEKIKKEVLEKNFLQLLKYIYTNYPMYAKNSIINLKGFEK